MGEVVPLFLTVKQVAEITGYHEETVTEALRNGELDGHQRKKGARWNVRPAAVEAWLHGAVAA